MMLASVIVAVDVTLRQRDMIRHYTPVCRHVGRYARIIR